MKNFLDKIINYSKSYDEKMKNKKERVKMPVLKLSCSPFTMIMDNFRKTLEITLVYSAILTILALALGYSVLCASNNAVSAGLTCSPFGHWYLFYLIVKLAVVSIFMTFFYDLISGREFSIKNLFVPGMRHLKSFAMLISFILLNLFPALSLYALYVREPNPKWEIEMIYFAFISIGFVVPFILMRFYSAFGYFIEKGKIPELLPIWDKTKDNMLKIISSVFIIILFSIFTLLNLYSSFSAFNPEYVWYSAFVSEFIYNILQLVAVALFIGNFYIQRVILIEDSENE